MSDTAYDKLVERIDELEKEKAELLDEIEALRRDNRDLRREVAGWRGGMSNSMDNKTLRFLLDDIAAGGPEAIDGDDYELVTDEGTGNISISSLCGEASNRLRELEAERDAMAAQIKAAQCIAARWHGNDDDIGTCLDSLEHWAVKADSAPTECLNRLIAEKQIEAFNEVAGWLDPKSETFGGPTYHEAELIGMEISGPTQCSSVTACQRAGHRAFKEAARIFSFRQQAEGGSDE